LLVSSLINYYFKGDPDINKGKMPDHKVISTQEAAAILNVSHQYLVGLLEAQVIPCCRVGTYCRICFGELMNYKNDRDAKRREGLTQMTKKSQRLGLYSRAANTLGD
jgi:excisionase family DNA binding protein